MIKIKANVKQLLQSFAEEAGYDNIIDALILQLQKDSGLKDLIDGKVKPKKNVK